MTNPIPTAPVEQLLPCPFCGEGLKIRRGVNPYGRCMTPDCWMAKSQQTVSLHYPEQIAAWNTRASHSSIAPGVEGEASVAVEQRDRDLAGYLHECIFGLEDAAAKEGHARLLNGERDTEFMIAALACHRVTALAPQWRPEVIAFANLMERQLRANDHKTGWKSDTARALFSRLTQEAMELGDEVRRPRTTTRSIGREAADVANFAMMVADVSGALKDD